MPVPQSLVAKLEEEVPSDQLLVPLQPAEDLGVPNGSRDRFGRPRLNVGGRPRKLPIDLTGVAGPTENSNRSSQTRAPRRLEISGHAQLKLLADVKARFAEAAQDPQARIAVWRSIRSLASTGESMELTVFDLL